MGEAIPGQPLQARAEKGGKDIGDEYSIPAPEPFVSFSALKDRIRHHYEVCSDYYYSLWGEHIHHGYFIDPSDTKEVAQTRLISLLLEKSVLPAGSTVLDVGCGIGGTSRYLAREKGCKVTGVTISPRQVEIATKFSTEEASSRSQEAGILTDGSDEANSGNSIKLGKLGGNVKFIELDAEKMGEYFINRKFDCVWISEAMSHLPNKALFFQNAAKLLYPGGKLVVADWFKSEECSEAEMEEDIKPIEGYFPISEPCELSTDVIEDGMLLPPLCTQSDYVNFAKEVGFRVFSDPFDISKEVAKTWYVARIPCLLSNSTMQL
jgi:tocopherol O-methyltransferase